MANKNRTITNSKTNYFCLIVLIVILFVSLFGCHQSSEQVDANNTFYFSPDIKTIAYSSFFSTPYEESPLEYSGEEVNVINNRIFITQNTAIYELRIDADSTLLNAYSPERLRIGYFYVENDKIYLLDNLDPLDEDYSRENILKHATLVCQNEPLEDSLSNDEKGWHEWIVVDGDKREYHSYNNLVETGFYEAFIWEKNVGLVEYRSGFGAQRDAIELFQINTLKNAKITQDEAAILLYNTLFAEKTVQLTEHGLETILYENQEVDVYSFKASYDRPTENRIETIGFYYVNASTGDIYEQLMDAPWLKKF